MIQRSLREWETIAYGEDAASIPEAHAARLIEVAGRSPFAGRGGEGVLEYRRKHLRARGVVGVIASPGCQLEILPKIEAIGEANATDEALRRRLVHMLAVARDIRIDARNSANLGWQRDTLLEILIRLFCRKMIEAVRQGIPRRYIAHEDDLPALRGRLDVTRQFSTLAAQPQTLACRYDELSPNIALNQIMKATISRIACLATAADNQRSLRELSFAYSDIAAVPPAALRWDLIILDRTNQRWHELLSLARLLLGERYQTTSVGSTDGQALLFEMSTLFEAYVARLLQRALAGTAFRVTTQGGHRDCLYEDGTGRFRTRPDILIRDANGIAMVVDTKWKRITPRIDDPKQGVSQADVYQLMAYSRIYECDRVMLLYPHHHELSADPLCRSYDIVSPNGADRLIVSTVDVSASHSSVAGALASLVSRSLSPRNAAVI
ncbi:McrC family protein [Paracoccus seriniphilus]|uniref:5-methylcytosine-specific restriction enzyme subunit McrC n=1 Tax=Paracoccus seriniphilus TaxID=184748 RepID=A0A239PYG2_9RHOB|nr:restriction endonuclease [Paracoccus seriniphilus]WCR14672.1 restriction endonuclease [Paracoccus seriniphilus]SNT75314.1 5-methylcytosine-specific restriction enzyme subunit McrC [Paracoccus seriniphilus]